MTRTIPTLVVGALALDKHNAMAVNLPQKALTALHNNPNVEFAEEDVKRYPMAESLPFGIPMVQADQVSDVLAGNQTVCIIDSGYGLSHEDLSGNNVAGSNDPGTGFWYTDENSHGTHVAGIIAAAGNDGNTRHSYPASYDSVMSIAAIDSNKMIADFSQQTDQVELSGPGVDVLSSVPVGMGLATAFSVAGNTIEASGMEGSPQGNTSGC